LNSEPAPLADSDYDRILSAVMETARGRWFLHEYVHRNRNADTGTLLAAIDRIESLLKARESEDDPEAASTPEPSGVIGIVVQLRQIAENLIECGAPTYLCNDLVRRIEDLASAFMRPADMAAAAEAQPLAVDRVEVAQVAVAEVDVAVVEIVAGETLRDPFADILALSPEERIALFT
jgi:hypothetical protein